MQMESFQTCPSSWQKFVSIQCNIYVNLTGLQDTSIQQGIQQLRENVTQISTLRIESLNTVSEASLAEIEKIDSLSARTRTLIQSLKERIKSLESAPLQQDAQLRKNRVTSFFSDLVL